MDGYVVLDTVNHLDDDAIALPGDYLGAGELAVHRGDGAGGAQPCHLLHRHLPKSHAHGKEHKTLLTCSYPRPELLN